MIKQEIMEFYKALMGTAAEELTMEDKLIIDKGPKLQVAQQRLLIEDCSEQEVNEALFSMNSNKAPGIDGFNVCFFKKCWHIIGVEVVQAFQQFFQTGNLPKEMNLALITLLPKCDNASTMKEFRPIVCCTVLYKNNIQDIG